ncbi:hypothetical protein [Chryseobacterium sp. WLY505]|uniref:hypothetical protein n=1 Tax=Chryseobacterium sp. WLY505 TaxID=3068892 RepID=UPI002796D2A1|nr:hypothetical protein [Chryseobacterium sp. WLY505]MDQ1859278.1 hypothetical protein [Chryseobacterium sp. WLY505]
MKTKFIKVSTADRLPIKNLYVSLIDSLGNTCNGYYSEKNNWIIATEGYFSIIEFWLEEKPDYEEEMKEMINELILELNPATLSGNYQEAIDKAKSLLSKAK